MHQSDLCFDRVVVEDLEFICCCLIPIGLLTSGDSSDFIDVDKSQPSIKATGAKSCLV